MRNSMEKGFLFVCLLSVLLFSFNLTSASNVTFIGTIYNQTLFTESIVNNASVEIICNGISQNTTSDNLGYYSYSFSGDVCIINSTYIVSAKKDNYFGSTGEKSDIADFADHVNSSNESGRIDVDAPVVLELMEEPEMIIVDGFILENDSIIDANISLLGCSGTPLTSDIDGYYRFKLNDDCSNYIIEVKKDGYYDNNSKFNVSEDNSHNISITKKPTCSDGIQNGEETGVDCGGSICEACSSGGSSGGSSSGSGSSGGSGGWVNPHCDDGFHVGDLGSGVLGCVPDALENVTLEDLNMSEADFNEHSSEPGFWDKILAALTGAVIGGGAGGWVAGGLFALLVLILYLYVKKKMVK